MSQFLHQAWTTFLSAHWLFSGVANTMVLFVIARILAFGYREHAYLYQFEDKTKALDTWIEFVLPFVRRIGLPRYRADVSLKLSRSGTRHGWDSSHFIASQLIFGVFTAISSTVLLNLLIGMPLFVTLVLTALALLFPYLKLTDVAHTRFTTCNRDLPYFIDYLSLAMGAGLDFNQALATVIADAPKSPLVDEFALTLRNMRLGMSRADALLEMERRMSSPSLKLFVQTLVQGMELGTDVVTTLSAMSETLQQRRFQRAEEAAGKISVKMMIPMMCFVMPAVMIVLLGPMILTYVKAG